MLTVRCLSDTVELDTINLNDEWFGLISSQ